jgi:hypothetical protein
MNTNLLFAEELRQMAFTTDDEVLGDLHQRCEDRGFAEVFIRALQDVSSRDCHRAAHWIEAIREMHPDLVLSRGVPILKNQSKGDALPATAKPGRSNGGCGGLLHAAATLFGSRAFRHRNKPGVLRQPLRK